MIHEEIFHFPKLNLNRVCSFAQGWQEETGSLFWSDSIWSARNSAKFNICRKTS